VVSRAAGAGPRWGAGYQNGGLAGWGEAAEGAAGGQPVGYMQIQLLAIELCSVLGSLPDI
jgi:hypothetical protein